MSLFVYITVYLIVLVSRLELSDRSGNIKYCAISAFICLMFSALHNLKEVCYDANVKI
jgi:hypothetical protein